MAIRALVTGANGFLASWLIDHYLEHEKNVEVWGTVRKGADKRNIAHVLDQVHLVDMDLTDAHSVRNVIREVKPDKVFHLGAHTYVPTSWSSPAYTFEANVLGTLHILEAVRENCKDAYVQIAGSSEEYGRVLPAECPIREDQPLRPMSPYGVSKIAADKLGYQYARSYGLNICVSRTFNQSGGRRGIDFFDSNWCNQVALMEVGQHKHELRHGNLDAIRDLSDARDTVQVYAALARLHKPNDPGVFNVCSGFGIEMGDALDTLKGLSRVKFTTVQDPDRLRPSDVPLLIGSNDKLIRYFGDAFEIPTRSYDDTLSDLLDFWREQVK
jgi:GDP-4-dehydro-6-deoxy-D-mannose reductase